MDVDEPAWGRIVQKASRIFLHVYELPADGRLELPGNLPEFSSATVLESDEALANDRGAGRIALKVGKALPDERVSVIVLS